MVMKDTNSIFVDFLRVDQIFNRLYREAATRMGLSGSVLDVLYSVNYLGEGCLQKDICATSYLPKQRVHSAVDKLVSAGLLRKESSSGRAVALYLTAAGERFVERRIVPIVQAEKRAFESMSTEEQQHFYELAMRLADAFRDQVKDLSLEKEG